MFFFKSVVGKVKACFFFKLVVINLSHSFIQEVGNSENSMV